MSARSSFHWGMSTFLVTPSMCCVFICTTSRHTLKTCLCCAFYWESHAMTTPSICCVFILYKPNKISILGSGGDLQLPRAKKKLIELSFKNPVAPAGMVRPHRFEVWTRFAWGLLHMKNQHAELCHLKCSCHCKLADWTRIPSLFEGLYIWKHSMLEYWQPTCFLESFPGGLMLAYVAGSVSTDLNVWGEWHGPCVSQAVCHSATTASVVWPLALDFIFTRCVSPCPWNFYIGCCANEKPLDWSHTGAFDFSRLCLYQHWYWGKGGDSLNPIQASENIMILETVPPQ